MNNPLVQRAQYYLNESHRLTEELNTQIEYSRLLEAVLEELVGTENFLAILEKSGLSPETRQSYAQKALTSIGKQTRELATHIPLRQEKAMAIKHKASLSTRNRMRDRHGDLVPTETENAASADLAQGRWDAANAKRIIAKRTTGIGRAIS